MHACGSLARIGTSETGEPSLKSSSKQGRLLHVSPVYRIWAIWMNQMPCSITSMARTVGIKPCSTVPYDVLHHAKYLSGEDCVSEKNVSSSLTPTARAEPARARRELINYFAAGMGTGRVIYVLKSSGAGYSSRATVCFRWCSPDLSKAHQRCSKHQQHLEHVQRLVQGAALQVEGKEDALHHEC